MRKFVPFWQEIRFPKNFGNDRDQQEYVIRLILVSSVLVLLLTSLVLFVFSFNGKTFGTTWQELLITFSLLAIGLLMIRWGKLQLVGYLMVSGLYIFGLIKTMESGLDTIFILYYFVALVITFMIIPHRWATIGVLMVGPPVTYFLSPWLDEFEPGIALAYLTMMIMIIVLLSVFTRFKEAFATEHQRVREIQTIQQAGTSIVSSLDFQETIEKILEELKNIIPHDSASVLLMQDDHGLKIVGGSGWHDLEEVIGSRIPIPGDNPNTKVIQDGRPFILGNAPSAYPMFKTHPYHHIRSWLGVPLFEKENIIGMMAIDSVKENYFTEGHLQIVMAFADYVAAALENALLYDFANQSIKRRSILYQVSQEMITASADLDKIYQAIYNAAQELMACEAFAISLLDGTEQFIEGVFLIDRGSRRESIRIPVGSGLSGKVIQSGKSVLINDLAQSLDFELQPFGFQKQVQSLIAVPLRTADKIIGMLSAQSYQVGAYSQDDLELLELFGAQAAIAIKNAQLLAEMDRTARTDSLTGLLNRRAFDEILREEISRAKRYGYSLSLLIIDIDDFKQFNDKYGHSKGDGHLKTVANLILSSVRQPDLVARIGGEEFSVILPHTIQMGGQDLAERIRKSIEARFFGSQDAGSTVSIGVAEFPLDADSVQKLFDSADKAMFAAKHLGKNKVVTTNGMEWKP